MKQFTLRKARLDVFFAALEPALHKAIEAHPEDYASYTSPATQVPAALARIRASVERAATFQAVLKDSPAIRATCKALKIKHTYAAINAWLSEGPLTREEEQGLEVDFPSRETALARAIEDGAKWREISPEVKRVTLYRPSRLPGNEGCFGYCVVFQRSCGHEDARWCRTPWLYAHDGLPATAVESVLS
jgi:hypothetical protein